ncbi:probable E3 ubiquitin-protein ligase TRIML1 [Notamacropus eugenii]|uniref:probable E3 ubiquitin-protein ligase TRIML1 n=1 Tax=Notamacropus eugenii TaxID=9315 RepID=UPI003B67AABC
MTSLPELIQNFQEELICSICRDYFTEPMSIECGHRFCQSCLFRSWQEASMPFPCPECRSVFQEGEFKANVQLGKLADIDKRLTPHCLQHAGSYSKCETHQKVQKLFCEDDQILICVSCSESKEHKAHILRCIDKAAEDSREKLQESVTYCWRKTKDVVQQMDNDMMKLAQDMKGVLKRNDSVIHKEENVFLINKIVLPIPGILEMLLKFKVDITLDPDTAHPGLIISEDLKSMRYEGTQPEVPISIGRFTYFATALGIQCLLSSRYYWAVEVPDNTGWCVGISNGSPGPEVFFVLMSIESHSGCHLFAIGKPHISSVLHVKYCQNCVSNLMVGIFLDYEHGELSFYNVKERSLIFSFPTTSFSGFFQPFFCLSKKILRNDCSLMICP